MTSSPPAGPAAAWTLAGLVADKQLAPRGRSLAFGWLEARDPARAAVLLGGMLDDEALDLRRAAVAKLLADAAAGDAAAQAASHRQALAAARDVDQVEAIATWLTEHGEPTDVAGALGFVRQWKVSGEYDNVGGVGFAKAYPPAKAPPMNGPSSVAPDLREAPLDRDALETVGDVHLYPGLDARGARAQPKRRQAEARRQDGVPSLALALRR
jgi:hypothetical protein